MYRPISLLALVAIIVMTLSTAETIKTIQAQAVNTTTPASTTKAKGKPVGLFIILLGLNKISGDIITYATIKNGTKNATKAVVSNAKELDLTDTLTDGIGKTYLYFPNTLMHAGDKITGCYIGLKTLEMFCNTFLKSPDFKRSEVVTLLINSTK
jgi:hypothetical protein